MGADESKPVSEEVTTKVIRHLEAGEPREHRQQVEPLPEPLQEQIPPATTPSMKEQAISGRDSRLQQSTMEVGASETKLEQIRQRRKACLDEMKLGLSTKEFSIQIPTNHQAQNHALETHGEESWEHIALAFLHRKSVQIALATLLLLDVIILFAELALLTVYPSCNLIERDAISCCPAPAEHRKREILETTGSGGDGDHGVCADGLVSMNQDQYEAGCDDHKWHKVHTAEEFLFGMTIAILCLFFVELCVTMWAIKPWVFFRQLFYALDFLIVTVSIVLELTFHVLGDDALSAMLGLLIMGRIWRFVRIGHGIVELVHDMNRHEFEELLEHAEQLEVYTRCLEQKLVMNSINLPDPPVLLSGFGNLGTNADPEK